MIVFIVPCSLATSFSERTESSINDLRRFRIFVKSRGGHCFASSLRSGLYRGRTLESNSMRDLVAQVQMRLCQQHKALSVHEEAMEPICLRLLALRDSTRHGRGSCVFSHEVQRVGGLQRPDGSWGAFSTDDEAELLGYGSGGYHAVADR